MKDLAIISLKSSTVLTKKIEDVLNKWLNEPSMNRLIGNITGFSNKESEIPLCIEASCPRFGTGEAKGLISNSVRGKDVYIFVDVCNHSLEYKMFGKTNYMSPDDHYQDLKRVISACNGKAERITVVMPFLYEGRQHKQVNRESLDCSMMLNELVTEGVDRIITFDAHDPRIQNAIPYNSLENVSPIYQMIETFIHQETDINIDKEELIIISPDEGATERAIKLASIMEVGMGMFYKQRDYSTIVDGRNPILAHEYLGPDLENKDVIVIDDMISSGDSIIDVCKQLKARKARKIYIFSTFGLFTNGFENFDKAYREGLFDTIYTTNCIYQMSELKDKCYYVSVSMETYIAALIHSLNENQSINTLINPIEKSKELIKNINLKKC